MLVIRHGEPAPQFSALLLGTTDAPVDPAWMFRPRVRRRLRVQPRVVSSPLARALETAKLVVEDAAVDPRLKEMCLGEWEGQSKSYLAVEYPEAFGPDLVVDVRFRIPGAEQLEKVAERGLAALIEHHLSGYELVVTHSGVMRAILLGLGSDVALKNIPYGEGFEFVLTGGGPQVTWI